MLDISIPIWYHYIRTVYASLIYESEVRGMAERVEIRATGRDRKIFVDGTEIKDVAEYQLEQSNKVLALTLKILITGNLTLE